jgi:hypothetical protein
MLMRDAISEPMAAQGLFSITKIFVTITILCCTILPSINYHYPMQFNLVTSRARSLTTFLTCWGQVCVVFRVQVPVTLCPGRTPSGSINLCSLLREILIARLLHPYTWGLPNHSYERASKISGAVDGEFFHK